MYIKFALERKTQLDADIVRVAQYLKGEEHKTLNPQMQTTIRVLLRAMQDHSQALAQIARLTEEAEDDARANDSNGPDLGPVVEPQSAVELAADLQLVEGDGVHGHTDSGSEPSGDEGEVPSGGDDSGGNQSDSARADTEPADDGADDADEADGSSVPGNAG